MNGAGHRPVAGVVVALALLPALAACGALPRVTPAASASPVVDGLAIGPDRAAGTTVLFHHLETAARDWWHEGHPGDAMSGFSLHQAGVLSDGSIQAGTDDAFVWLGVIDTPRDGQHAVVLRCDLLADTAAGRCAVVGPK